MLNPPNKKVLETRRLKECFYSWFYSGRFCDYNVDNSRFFLMRLGKKILNKSIHFHLFRHSSATYYATKLNRQELCYRYGWKFSSDMPDTYISRAGMEIKQLDEKFQATELESLQKKLERQEQQRLIDAAQKEDRAKELEALKEKLKKEIWLDIEKQMQEAIAEGRIILN